MSRDDGILGSSIFSRLQAGFALCVLFPALSISVSSALSGLDDAYDRKIDQLWSVVQLKSEALDQWKGQVEEALRLLSSERRKAEALLPILRGELGADEARSVLEKAREDFMAMVGEGNLFSEVLLIDARGRVAASTDPAREGAESGSAEFFKIGLQKSYIAAQPRSSAPGPRGALVAARPVVAPGRGAVGVLAAYCDPAALDRIMGEPPGLGRSGACFLVDARLTFLAGSRAPWPAGRAEPKTEAMRTAGESRLRGAGTYRDQSGVSVIGAYAWLPALEAALVVQQDRTEVYGPALRTLAVNLLIAFASIFLSTVLAYAVMRGIAGPLHALAGAAARVADGDLDHVVEMDRKDEIGRLAVAFNAMIARLRDLIRRLNDEIAERRLAAEQVRRSLAEKEVLLRELHHRTKNNMAVIIGLLDMESAEVGDPRLERAFVDTQNRIRTMALVHQKLYEARDLSRIGLEEYVRDLSHLLASSYGFPRGMLSVAIEVGDSNVSIDTAIPCGLILNELVSNAQKHAFPGGGEGRVRLVLRRLDSGEFLLGVSDDGVGLPPGFDPRRDGRMGLRTLMALAERQLSGSIEFSSGPGFACEVRFRDRE